MDPLIAGAFSLAGVVSGAALSVFAQRWQEDFRIARERRAATIAVAVQTRNWIAKLSGLVDLVSGVPERQSPSEPVRHVNGAIPSLPYEASWMEISRLAPQHLEAVCDLMHDLGLANANIAFIAEVANPDEVKEAFSSRSAGLLTKAAALYRDMWATLGCGPKEAMPKLAMAGLVNAPGAQRDH